MRSLNISKLSLNILNSPIESILPNNRTHALLKRLKVTVLVGFRAETLHGTPWHHLEARTNVHQVAIGSGAHAHSVLP